MLHGPLLHQSLSDPDFANSSDCPVAASQVYSMALFLSISKRYFSRIIKMPEDPPSVAEFKSKYLPAISAQCHASCPLLPVLSCPARISSYFALHDSLRDTGPSSAEILSQQSISASAEEGKQNGIFIASRQFAPVLEWSPYHTMRRSPAV
jgi:hypothetical protein